MTLEDFFTLTEMKNGLTTPARVEELISVIQRQKACSTSNGVDAIRQWSTVASTLASTENQDCLSHFVYLNGLCFLNQWLHEAVKGIQYVLDAEESINVLLGFVEKLPVDWKMLSASGILVNIEKLLVHESTSIKLRAHTFLERWNNKRISDDGCKEIEEGCLNHVDTLKPSADAASVEDKLVVDQNLDKNRCELLVEEQICKQESNTNLQKRSPNGNIQPVGTEKLHVESFVAAPVGMASSSAPVCSEFLVKDGDECVTSSPKNDGDIDAEMSTGIADSNESSQRESLCTLSSTSPAACSPKKPTLEQSASFILESTGDKFSMSEPVGTNPSGISESKMRMNEPALNSRKKVDKKLDFELESGEFDALEVARLVAIEVEREVVDYREQSCSSSTDVISRDIASSGNHDITENKQDHEITGEPNGNGLVAGIDDSDTATSPKNDSFKFSEATAYVKTGMQKLESQNQTAADHKSSCRSLNKKCEFDLNVDASSENLDVALYAIPSNPNNLSAPIAVSASKGSHGWAVTPLHFEGEGGWRGSASTSAFRPATSAFRPASPKRALEFEKTSPGSKPKRNRIDIDLNVADGESDLVKEFPVSYCIPSRDSSVEVSSGRAARMQLDLNSLGDEEAPSLQSSLLSHHHQKGSTSLSPTSSSSSMKPSIKNFNLNDNPAVLDGISNSSITYGFKVNDPFFNVLGANIPMERRDYTNEAHPAWMGTGFSWDTVMAGRPLMPYAPPVLPPGYAYNGLGMVPAFPFQPTLYANSSIPHMGSSSALGAPVLSTRPFLMSISSTPSSSNVVEPSNPGLDLNREAGGMKHFFMPGRSNLLEEQARTASQQSTSGTPPLRGKEPDSGWEPYGFGYNQVTSWH